MASKSKIKPEDVILSENNLNNRSYEIIGDLSVRCRSDIGFIVFSHSFRDKKTVNRKLQTKAAELGADAVGQAVKFTKPR